MSELIEIMLYNDIIEDVHETMSQKGWYIHKCTRTQVRKMTRVKILSQSICANGTNLSTLVQFIIHRNDNDS